MGYRGDYGPRPAETTGAEAERDTFGRVKLGKMFQETLRAKSKDGYLQFAEALEIVRKFTENDPEAPEAEFAKDLRLDLLDLLEEAGYTEGKLKFFATNGTPIDRYHGVDAFYEYFEEGMAYPAGVTLDVTKNSNKGTEYKADVVFTVPPEPEAEDYLAYVSQIAQECWAILKSRIDESKSRGPKNPAPKSGAPGRRRLAT